MKVKKRGREKILKTHRWFSCAGGEFGGEKVPRMEGGGSYAL